MKQNVCVLFHLYILELISVMSKYSIFNEILNTANIQNSNLYFYIQQIYYYYGLAFKFPGQKHNKVWWRYESKDRSRSERWNRVDEFTHQIVVKRGFWQYRKLACMRMNTQ